MRVLISGYTKLHRIDIFERFFSTETQHAFVPENYFGQKTIFFWYT